MNVDIRRCRLEDYEKIVEMQRLCGIPNHAIDSLKHFKESVSDKNQFPNVATDISGNILGAVTIVAYFSGYGYIGRLVVHPDYRRKGIGYSLGVATKKALRNAGAERISCYIHPDNKASVKLFEKLGFKVIDRIVYDKNLS
jgi:ribosomal protein S18 acetylase RimI-like enzyme